MTSICNPMNPQIVSIKASGTSPSMSFRGVVSGVTIKSHSMPALFDGPFRQIVATREQKITEVTIRFVNAIQVVSECETVPVKTSRKKKSK